MRHEDLECGDEVSQGDGLVALPVLVGLKVIDEDDEVVLGALVVNLDLLSSALHFDCRLWCFWLREIVWMDENLVLARAKSFVFLVVRYCFALCCGVMCCLEEGVIVCCPPSDLFKGK